MAMEVVVEAMVVETVEKGVGEMTAEAMTEPAEAMTVEKGVGAELALELVQAQVGAVVAMGAVLVLVGPMMAVLALARVQEMWGLGHPPTRALALVE